MMRPASILFLTAAAGLLLTGCAAGPDLPAAERGRRLAERQGCFGCHGPEGLRGAPNPGRTEEEVPGFGGDVMMYADGTEQIREWIRRGVTRAREGKPSYQAERRRGLLRMPAFGHRLSARQIDDLTAFVAVSAGIPEPVSEAAQRGYRRAELLGCFSCHGPGGRFARPNARSFKGVVPSWEGADFGELVRDRAEFEEWVRRGRSRRFAENPLARFFLDRATLQMPAYQGRLEPGDLDALWSYVAWLRAQ